MHDVLASEFESLLGLWRSYDDIRREHRSIKELGEARLRLDSVRDRVSDLRMALSPREDELADAAETVMCDALGVPVAISWLRTRRTEHGLELQCVCGSLIHRPASGEVGSGQAAGA